MPNTTALPRPKLVAPSQPIAEPPVAAAVRRILAKLDAQHAEITRLLREVEAALG
jgi:hypothetical protein